MIIKFNFKRLLAEKEQKEGKRILVKAISEETGISTTTLSLIANSKGDYKTNTEIIGKLCRYFDCTPNDLMTIVADSGEGKAE